CQERSVKISSSVVEAKLALLQVEIEVFATNAAAFRKARLGGTPEAFDAVDMDAAAADEHAIAVLDAKMLATAEVDQAVVANPAVGVNDAGEIDATANNGP